MIGKVIENGLIEKVFGYLTHDEIDFQIESGWIVTNVAAGNNMDVKYLMDHDVIEKMMPLLYSSNEKVWSQAVWAYGNLAAESIQVRNMVNKEEIIKRIVAITIEQTQILKASKSPDALRYVQSLAWAMSNSCGRKPNPDFQMVKLFLPGLLALLDCTDDKETIEATCWAFSCLTDGGTEQIQEVLDSGFLPLMMKIMREETPTGKQSHLSSIRVLGNLASGNEEQTQQVIDLGGIQILLEHASAIYSKGIRKEACWALSNICAGSEEQIRAVVDYPYLLASMVEMLSLAPFQVQAEMAWIFANIAEKGILSLTMRLHECGCVRALLPLLDVHDSKVVLVCLGAIYQIGRVLQQEVGMIDEFDDFKETIENNGGLDIIEQLQTSPNHSVYMKALQILETFFDAVEEGVDAVEDARRNVINEG